MTLDVATISFLADMAKVAAKPLSQMSPGEARGFGRMLRATQGAGPEMASVWDETIPTPDGSSFQVRMLVPEDPPRALIVYYHGGGWVLGGRDDSDRFARELARRTAAAVAVVDYRLAPEHRCPTAAEDAWTALLWIDEHLARIAGGRVPLVVAGDSAGGNLAAVVTHLAKDQGGPQIAAQVLVYPVTDADIDTPSYLDPANQLMLSRASMIWFWDHYAPDPSSRVGPDASPLRRADLSGLPPAVVVTAAHDVLCDEGEAYADKLRTAGVPVEHRRFAGQMHGFITLVDTLPGSAAGLEYIAEQLDRRLEHRQEVA